MKFRTEIEIPQKPVCDVSHAGKILMLGSCFTDNVGSMLDRDGFDVMHNPLGPLYNPASIAMVIERAAARHMFTDADMVADSDGIYHCLWFTSRYQHRSVTDLVEMVNADFAPLCDALHTADTVIITLGTSYCFHHTGMDSIVGNCHKFPACEFSRRMLSHSESANFLADICTTLSHTARNIIFTLSPVRHTADTLHGNQLSKASLLLAIDKLLTEGNPDVIYFPAYEILLDDLRDYRFYAADMKHPSDTAVAYVYDVFSSYFFTPQTAKAATEARREYLKNAHRQIIDRK